MAASVSASTVNIVKYWFLKGSRPKAPADLQSVITLAYQTARDNGLYPKHILIRGGAHRTTSINGVYAPDPDGNHWTFCYKDEEHERRGTHIACHGYTPGPDEYTLSKATFRGEKRDSTIKKGSGRQVWPDINGLDQGPEIEVGYGHEA